MGRRVFSCLTQHRFDHSAYKNRTIRIWNELAPRYHRRWASTERGPFKCTKKLASRAGIRRGDAVLDLGCGTGAVTKDIRSRIGKKGSVIGLDFSAEALKIAKKFVRQDCVDFVLADAETVHFDVKFDVITCQYALFFFADSQKVLLNARRFLKKDGTIAVSVHGCNVPFFTCISDAVTKFIPDYPEGPKLDRFGTKSALEGELQRAGFTKIRTNRFVFVHGVGGFRSYWDSYQRYMASPLREKIGKLSVDQKRNLRRLVRQNTVPYTGYDGRIAFPWEVLISTARK